MASPRHCQGGAYFPRNCSAGPWRRDTRTVLASRETLLDLGPSATSRLLHATLLAALDTDVSVSTVAKLAVPRSAQAMRPYPAEPSDHSEFVVVELPSSDGIQASMAVSPELASDPRKLAEEGARTRGAGTPQYGAGGAGGRQERLKPPASNGRCPGAGRASSLRGQRQPKLRYPLQAGGTARLADLWSR